MTEQRWKWEISFTCGDKSSFLQYLLDNYTESDVVDMVTDIEDTKKAIEMQEKKIETGVTRSVLDGKPYAWHTIKNGDGVSAYKTKEEFDQECRETIEEWTRDFTDMQQNFKNLWEEYLNASDYYHSDGCTFEQEIRYVWRWCHDYQKILQIQDDISYVIVEDYF